LSEATTITRRISISPDVELLPLLGRNDDHLRTLEHELDVRIVARGHDITLRGEEPQVRRPSARSSSSPSWCGQARHSGASRSAPR